MLFLESIFSFFFPMHLFSYLFCSSSQFILRKIQDTTIWVIFIKVHFGVHMTFVFATLMKAEISTDTSLSLANKENLSFQII